jgi:alditol oxidase
MGQSCTSPIPRLAAPTAGSVVPVELVRNWSGNVTLRPDRVVRPTSLPELQQLVATNRAVHALGTGHTFNHIGDTTGVLIGLRGLPAFVDIDSDHRCVSVAAGLQYGEVAPVLDAAGFALANLGSLPHISVAGASATATHGSGVGNRVLASAVRSVELVDSSGELMTIERGERDFPGFAVSLGTLGVITRLVLDVQPTYQISQRVHEGLDFIEVSDQLDAILASGYSVSIFTDYQQRGSSSVWVKRRVERDLEPLGWTGGRLADGQRHPLPGAPADSATQQLGVPGPWYRRLPHFRLEFTPSGGDELQSEYFVSRGTARDALEVVHAARHTLAPVLLIAEIRAVAADELWLSPSYQRDTVALHFTWVNDEQAVQPVLGPLEVALLEVGATPHWGKVFYTSPAVMRARFPRWDDFAELRSRLDPHDRFGNAFLHSFFAT